MPDKSPILEHAAKVRRAMLARNQALINQVTRDYLVAYRALKKRIKTLAEAIALSNPTRAELINLGAMQTLLEGISKEMTSFAAILGDRLEAAIAAEIKQAGIDTLGYLQIALPGFDEAALLVNFTELNPAQVYQMFGFLDRYGPLYANLRFEFPAAATELLRETLLSGFIQGMNPRQIADLMSKATGMPLTWALNTARTSALWAYRSAAHLNYRNNSNVIKKWRWESALDSRTCLSCISMHGTEHDLSETLNDHHMGRCVIPGTLVSGPPIEAFVSRRYDGEVVSIRTASGKFLTVTPEHPIMTNRGWALARDLIVGDYVLSFLAEIHGCEIEKLSKASIAISSGVNAENMIISSPVLSSKHDDHYELYYGDGDYQTSLQKCDWLVRIMAHMDYDVLGFSDLQLDKITEISTESYAGLVYNMQTSMGWYVANGIVTHNCAAVPITKTWEELGIEGIEQVRPDWEDGETWFRALSDQQQIDMMGKSKWLAWKDNQFEFSQLSKPYTDKVYGIMRGEAPLKSILEDKAAIYKAMSKARTW